jgi:hypothetical protein
MIQALGLCRFSYPTANNEGFTRKVDLYDTARLERRFRFFETICLPPLRAQTDPDFRLLVLVGAALPAWAMARLAALVAALPQAVILVEPEGQPHVELCCRLLVAHRDPAADAVAEFRIDDDDAVAVNFIARLRNRARASRGLWAGGQTVEIDFHSGFALISGAAPQVLAVTVAHWTPAQAFVTRPDQPRTAFSDNHFTSWRRTACLSCPDPQMFIRSFHGDNDSGRTADNIVKLANFAQPEDLDATLARRFGIRLHDIAALPAAGGAR